MASAVDRPSLPAGLGVLLYPGLGLALGFSLVLNLALLTPSLYMLQVYDRVLVTRSVETLVMLSALALGTLLLLAWADRTRARLLALLGLQLERQLAPGLLLQRWQALARREGVVDGHRELQVLRQALAGPATGALLDAPWMPVYLLLIYAFDVRLGLLATACAALLLVLAVVSDRLLRAALPATQQGARAQQQWLDAAGANVEVLLAMGMGPGLAARWQARAVPLHEQALATGARTASLGAASRGLRQAVQVLMMALGAWLVIHDGVSPGVLVACTVILGRALSPIEQLVSGWTPLVEASLAWRRLDDLLQAESSRPAPMPLPRPQGRLAAEGVGWLDVASGRWLLRQVSLAVAPGEILALLGGSGAGKTTLARALVGVLPVSTGVVRLDGLDIRQWSPERLGPSIGYLPQDVELFAGSVADNIARFDAPAGQVDGERVIAAAQAAGAHPLICRLPQGYDTPVGEGGRLLSGGQRQRIALARALYGEPALLVLDEPDASLDAEGEEALVAALRAQRARGAAAVVVTQRKRLLAVADRLVVLRDGSVERVVSRPAGPHELGHGAVAPGEREGVGT